MVSSSLDPTDPERTKRMSEISDYIPRWYFFKIAKIRIIELQQSDFTMSEVSKLLVGKNKGGF